LDHTNPRRERGFLIRRDIGGYKLGEPEAESQASGSFAAARADARSIFRKQRSLTAILNAFPLGCE
jgi:hypothetical protein